MKIVCLDMEGVLTPEIWIAFADAVGIPELRRTTRDEPDYDKLMRARLEILDKHNLRLPDIQKVIGTMVPLPGARGFVETLRKETQLIVLSDTFSQFAAPLMAKLNWPTLFCNDLVAASDGRITGYKLRQQNGKREAVKALKSINMQVFAAGDSYNDIAMIDAADDGCLFRAPEKIKTERPDLNIVENYNEFLTKIEDFLTE
jgi:phosphoserine/homoserine phosphotransferase